MAAPVAAACGGGTDHCLLIAAASQDSMLQEQVFVCIWDGHSLRHCSATLRTCLHTRTAVSCRCKLTGWRPWELALRLGEREAQVLLAVALVEQLGHALDGLLLRV